MAAVAESSPAATKQKTEAHQTKQDFLKVFEKLKDELVEDPILAGQPESSKDWLRKMLDYNVPHGKLNRGMAVLDVLLAAKNGDVSDQEREAANILGWGIELLQAYFLVADDIMDSSVTRRGQPCWYLQPHVGMVAINDGIILESCIYRLLKLHFASHPAYVTLLELFHDTTHRTAHGQLLDTTTAPVGKVDLARYTEEIYMRIVTYKTAFYTFYLPVACGLALAGVTDAAALALAEKLCVDMGRYFQIQDDVLDAFGDPETIGKVGTDIQDSKCSWLVVKALAVASEAQRELLETSYGRDEPAAIAAVKELYRELGLPAAFAAYEQNSYEELVGAIEGQKLLPPAVFMHLLSKIYKRTKTQAVQPRATAQLDRDVASILNLTNGSPDPRPADISRTVLGIILGGGAGSRLYPLTKQRAKPAVPLGANYRLIDIPVSNCINSGVNKIYCLTQFNSASLNRHLSQAYNSNVGGYNARGFVEVLAASQTTTQKNWFQGTADAVRQYLWLFEEATRGGVEDYLILSGDHLYRMDYSEFVTAHRRAGAEITVAALPCTEKEAGAFGLMKIDDSGRILDFAEKPKGEELRGMQVDTTLLGLDAESAARKPYIASMGIYLCKASAMHHLLTDRFATQNDFGSDIIPGAKDLGMHVQAHLFKGYWEDIGTIRAFYESNLGLTDSPNPNFSFYDKDAPIYTMSRFLPPCKVLSAEVEMSILGDGCTVNQGSRIVHSVIGLRSRIGQDCLIEDTMLMGADYYEQGAELDECARLDKCVPIGVGSGSHIKGAIVDKNARIGRFCKIINVDGVEEANMEQQGYVIRDGIVVIIKDTTIDDGTII